jgi:RimJ/RimL family protein N-acetyltransferase
MPRIGDLWPLYGLRVRTDDVELRYPDEADIADLAELTREPIHDPSTMPFAVPWTDRSEEERSRGTLQWHWRARAEWSPEEWRLELVTVRHGEVVGTQGLHAKQFRLTGEVESGSWVGRRFQGQGIGKAMRRAVLHLAFAGLGARAARSGAFEDNSQSLSVSRAVGYVPDGSETCVRRGEPATMVRLLLTRRAWEQRCAEWPTVCVEGLEPCLSMFGAPPHTTDQQPQRSIT